MNSFTFYNPKVNYGSVIPCLYISWALRLPFWYNIDWLRDGNIKDKWWTQWNHRYSKERNEVTKGFLLNFLFLHLMDIKYLLRLVLAIMDLLHFLDHISLLFWYLRDHWNGVKEGIYIFLSFLSLGSLTLLFLLNILLMAVLRLNRETELIFQSLDTV